MFELNYTLPDEKMHLKKPKMPYAVQHCDAGQDAWLCVLLSVLSKTHRRCHPTQQARNVVGAKCATHDNMGHTVASERSKSN